jgi:hypothetical protein
LFALGTVTPDIALSEFKKCGFPIKDLNTVKEKQEIIVAVATILTMVTVAIIITSGAYAPLAPHFLIVRALRKQCLRAASTLRSTCFA